MIVVHCAYVLYYLYVIFILSLYIAVALRSPILARCLEVHTVCRMQNGARKALRVRVINVAEIMSLHFRCCCLASPPTRTSHLLLSTPLRAIRQTGC